MDNITHTLVGLMLARASMGGKPGGDRSGDRSHRAGMMMISANIPDIDVVSMFGGGLTYIEYHRSYAHALAFSPLMALIAPALIFAIFRARISWTGYALSLFAVLSHLVLDWTNAYGISMLLPFSTRKLRLDITDVVDPWIWLILL